MRLKERTGKDAAKVDGPQIDKDDDEILRVDSGCVRAGSNKEVGWDVQWLAFGLRRGHESLLAGKTVRWRVKGV
jgi:hypothetical protein